MKLSKEERRVIGTLVEKAYTTPEQCPLTLNSLVAGCNQKSCRDPVTNFDEGMILGVLDRLRQKGLAVLVRSGGSRVDRWRQSFADVFQASPKETAILAELLLRGPQTDGELRQRASRMVSIDSLDEVGSLLRGLEGREEPLVVRLSPPGRKRGAKFAHGLYPDDESDAPDPETWDDGVDAPPPSASPSRPKVSVDVEGELQALREQVDRLQKRVSALEEHRG